MGSVGPPLPGDCTIKLVDVPEMKYLSTNDPPSGEIWISGSHVATLGYYNHPEKTAEDFRKGGWFATGDVGEWRKDGTLRIIDRVKNLIKLAHGEYIALESIESKFKNSSYVDNICVVGDSEKTFLLALVVVNKDRLIHWATENGIADPNNFEELCKNRKARNEVLNSIISIGKSNKLKNVEIPKDVLLCHEEWTPQNELLTAAMKLKRGPVTNNFKKEIKKMYDEVGASAE